MNSFINHAECLNFTVRHRFTVSEHVTKELTERDNALLEESLETKTLGI